MAKKAKKAATPKAERNNLQDKHLTRREGRKLIVGDSTVAKESRDLQSGKRLPDRVATMMAAFERVEGKIKREQSSRFYLYPEKSDKVSTKGMFDVLARAGYDLEGYDSFSDAREAAVELSKLGGLRLIHVFREKGRVVHNSSFDNGKQIALTTLIGLIKK